MPSPETPVLVLNWNGWEDSIRCLESLGEQVRRGGVWLLDNGSTEDRTTEVGARFAGLRVLRFPENAGFAGGYNRGLRLAVAEGYELAYLLNNDCVATPGFLEAVVRPAMQNATLAGVGSCIAFAENPQFLLFDGEYHETGERLAVRFGVRQAIELNGAGMLVRLKAMIECGYFDERYFCYGEETEWCRRVVRHGWNLAVMGDSVVLHRRHGSDLNQNALYYRTRNNFIPVVDYSMPRRVYWSAWLTGRAAEAVRSAQAEGARERANSLTSAVLDGLRGRFGPRKGGQHPPAWSRALLRVVGWIRKTVR